jgi:hypothetical protein
MRFTRAECECVDLATVSDVVYETTEFIVW